MSSPSTTDRQIDANRQNALHSTGPKTPEGKARSSQNARKHGIFCKDLVVPGEYQQAFDLFKLQLVQSFNPRDHIELQLVEHFVADQWRIKRVWTTEKKWFEKLSVMDREGYARKIEKLEDTVEALKIDRGWRQGAPVGGLLGRKMAELEEMKATEVPLVSPAEAILRTTVDKDQELNKLHGYELRLRGSAYRALKELLNLRKLKQEETTSLTKEVAVEMTGTELEETEQTKQEQPAAAATEDPSLKNEANSSLSNCEEETCDQQRMTHVDRNSVAEAPMILPNPVADAPRRPAA